MRKPDTNLANLVPARTAPRPVPVAEPEKVSAPPSPAEPNQNGNDRGAF